MPSLNAELVAKDVLERVKMGKRINKYEIAKNRGYSDGMALKVKEKIEIQPAYQAVMMPVLKRMESIRDKALKALDGKDMNSEDARVLKELAESMTKQLQLLTGKATENVATTINIVRYDDTPLEIVNARTSELIQPSEVLTDDNNGVLDNQL